MIERIFQIIEYKGITKNKFYKETELSNGFLDKVKDIGVSKLEKIVGAYPEINPEWLISGKGSMLRIDQINYSINEKLLTDKKYSALSEIDFIKEKSPEILKNENKIFMINYRQRLSDSLQLLFSICNALKYLQYKFSKKEIDSIKYFESFFETIEDFEKGKIELTSDFKITLINLLDNSLSGIINKYTLKLDSLIGSVIGNWDDLLKD